MTVSEIQKQQQADLHARLWSIANTLRGKMGLAMKRRGKMRSIVRRYRRS